MPNLFGGSSSHPSYDGRYELGPHEDIVNWTHYWVDVDGRVTAETIDGRVYQPPRHEIPGKLLDYLAAPRKPWAPPVITEAT
jgi:hypothetical protein